MTMAVSSFRFEDCPPEDVVEGIHVKGHRSASSIDMSGEFFDCESAAVALKSGGNNQMVMVRSSAVDYSSDGGDSERCDGSRGYFTMSPVLLSSIKSCCEKTGRPANITIHFKDCTFQLHKFPLISKSGYLKRMLMDTKEITIPDECPGSPEIFDMVASFCYGTPVRMESSNVADLRCAAEFLQMTEEYGKANLRERSDTYLNQVALQSWQDTMVVLLHCKDLSPYAEELGIVNRCIECLAFLACIEMVDPVEKTSRHGTSAIESQFWSDISVNTRGDTSTTTTDSSSSSSPDWWMDDLLRLPCGLFERVIAAIRREGMQEKFVSQAIVRFVDRWVFTSSCSQDTLEDAIITTTEDRLITQSVATGSRSPSKAFAVNDNLVEAVVRLLPEEKDAVPISFLFSLLRCALACNSSADCKRQLEARIACQLELATISDFLYPFKVAEETCISAAEVSCMRRIVDSFMSQQGSSFSDPSEPLPGISSHDDNPENLYCSYAVCAVAKVWDEYLTEVARDITLTPAKFAELADVVPSYARATHDHLYRAIHVYLKVHPHFSQEERQMVCGILNCQKLSPEMCSHAVQNELMPLRMIVQAMFMQQLQTRNVLSGHLQDTGQSMRFDSLSQVLMTNGAAASWRRSSLGHRVSTTTDSFRSSRESFRSRHDYFRDDSFGAVEDDMDEDIRGPLGYMMKREAAFRQAALLKADYKATETRLQNLEQELRFMKKKVSGRKQQHPVSKCTSERFSSNAGAGRKKKNESLSAVPEGLTATSDIEEDPDAGGDVKFSARTGNGLGFVTRALRLITLGGFGRRKGAADGDAPTAEPMYSSHMLCGGKGIWRSHNQESIVIVKPKKSEKAITSTLDTLAVHSSGLCASDNAVKTRHKRRHSIS